MGSRSGEWKIGDKIFVTDAANSSKLNARIVAVNSPKNQVKLRFIGWNPKPDEWFNMDSDCLEHSIISSKASPGRNKPKLSIGQKVLGVWSDGIWYPGEVSEVRSAGSVMIHFYDGLKKALRLNQVRAVSADEYKKRLDEVLKTAEEMDRSLQQASSVVTLGRTRRQDQAARNADSKVQPTSAVRNQSTPTDLAVVGDKEIKAEPDSSDIDDTPLSAFATSAKRPRRSTSRGIPSPVVGNVSSSDSTPRIIKKTGDIGKSGESAPDEEPNRPRRAANKQSLENSMEQRSNSRPSSRSSQHGAAEKGQDSAAKLRRRSGGAASNGILEKGATSVNGGSIQLTIVHCMCGKTRQDPDMKQCSCCMTWQHSACCGHHSSSSDIYVCHFCLNPSGAFADLPYRMRANFAARRSSAANKRTDGSSRLLEDSCSSLPQLVLQTEAVVALLRKSRQLMSDVDNLRQPEKQTELINTINAIHSYADELLSKIENASDAEAERIATPPSGLNKVQAEKLSKLSLRDVMSDLQTLKDMMARAEAVAASTRKSSSQLNKSSTPAVSSINNAT